MKEENKGTVIVSNSTQLEPEAEPSDLEVEDFSIDEPNADKDTDPVESSDSSLDSRELPSGTSSSESALDSNTNILRTIFSRKTLYHVLVLFILLTIFGILSYFDSYSDIVSKVIIVLGYGFSFGYLLTAILSRFESVRNFSSSEKPTSLIVPMSFSIFFSILIFVGLNQSYGSSLESFFKFGLIFIFILWQFAQAWWMRIPFKELALKRMNTYPSEGNSNLGRIGNIVAPIFWSLVGLSVFYSVSTYVPSFADNFTLIFIISWISLMVFLGLIVFYYLRKMHDNQWTNPKIASFSAFFAIGYWGFLSYHVGILLYSMFNEPSFVFDLFFMILTIMLIIYSLSVQTLRAESRHSSSSQDSTFSGRASGFMTKSNVIFYSISFTLVYGASSFFLATDSSFIGDVKNVSRLSHLIVIVSGLLVLLIVNYNLLTGRGLTTKGFIESMRTPKNN